MWTFVGILACRDGCALRAEEAKVTEVENRKSLEALLKIEEERKKYKVKTHT